MQTDIGEFEIITIVQRVNLQGVLDSITQQSPEIIEAINQCQIKFARRVHEKNLRREDWFLASHSISFNNGMVVTTYILERRQDVVDE